MKIWLYSARLATYTPANVTLIKVLILPQIMLVELRSTVLIGSLPPPLPSKVLYAVRLVLRPGGGFLSYRSYFKLISFFGSHRLPPFWSVILVLDFRPYIYLDCFLLHPLNIF